MRKVVTLGETMALMSAERTGPLRHGRTLGLGIGGSESNVAIALTRLGVPTTWIGRVGQDALGDLVVSQIAGEGVEVRAARDPDAPTGLMIKERPTPATARIWYYRRGSAGSRLSGEDVDPDLVAGAALLHVSGISLALSPDMADVVLEVMRAARVGGVPVSFDLNYRGRLWDRPKARTRYLQALELADIAFASADEATIVTGATLPPEASARLLGELGPRETVVTSGEAGAVAYTDGCMFKQPAVPIVPVDTVGAGDAFVGGYLAEWLAGSDPPRRLLTGAAAGAYTCLNDGDWEGAPTRAELEGLLAAEPVTR